MNLSIVPLSITEARSFVGRVHRHHQPPLGGLFAIGAAAEGEVVACVIVGRPVSRVLDADPYTCEVTRLASDGSKNACSLLYAAAWRAARAMGYRRLITYTLKTEPGSSLRAVGFKVVGEVTKRSWDTPSRPRVDKDERQERLRWELVA